MRSCAGAMLLLSLLPLRLVDPKPETVSCKHLFKGGSEWNGWVGDRYCYKRLPKQLVTKPDADKLCRQADVQATLPQSYPDEVGPGLFVFWELCWDDEDKAKGTYWMGVHKRGDKWVYDDGREIKGAEDDGSVKDPKYSVWRWKWKGEDKDANGLAFTCCQHKLNEPITKAPSTTVRTPKHYTPSRTQKDTPSKPIIYTRPDPHQLPSTTAHKPVTTKPGFNLEPKGTAGGMSTTLLLILELLGGAMLVAALIGAGIYLAHSKKKKRRRHHHGRRHAEPPSITAKTDRSTSAF